MHIEQEAFRSALPIQIRFNDVDSLGHVNNNIYLSYFDLGKVSYFENLQSMYETWAAGIILVARIEMDFLKPVLYGESIVVESKIIKVGTKSAVFLQQIRDTDTDEVKCRCKSVVVAYDPQSEQSMPIPDIWRKGITEFEGTDF